jgi:hypothetical protein
MRKAQAALEFVVLTSVMFLYFALTTIYVQGQLVEFTHEGKLDTIEYLQQAIVQELALADQMPEGYERTFTLPDSVQGLPYSIEVQEETFPVRDELIITYPEEQAVVFLTQDVTGTLRPGVNTIRKTTTIQLN